jgi:uroporphyrinogen-III decarboxylase
MTGRERLLAALRGQPVDRVPIWLREGFEVLAPIPPADDFRNGWRNQPLYQSLRDYVAPHVDLIAGWGVGGHLNRFLMIPPASIVDTKEGVCGDTLFREGYIDTPKGRLPFRREWKHYNNNGWLIQHPVNSIEDLEKVADVPFRIDADSIRASATSFEKAVSAVGDRGIVRLGISSPIVVISGLMDLQLFLELSYTHREYFHDLLVEITDRTLQVLDIAFGGRALDTTANLGGSEQCTPPMMRPKAFDDFVVPYDGKVINWLKDRDVLVNVHCHGKVRHALRCMLDMDVDATDPVEPPPAGDVTYAEAREIAGNDLTLVGNVEWDELTAAEPEEIRDHVRNILSHGNRRLILSTSAGPNTYVSERTATNYRALVDTALELG